jgi:hypothetical protein
MAVLCALGTTTGPFNGTHSRVSSVRGPRRCFRILNDEKKKESKVVVANFARTKEKRIDTGNAVFVLLTFKDFLVTLNIDPLV